MKNNTKILQKSSKKINRSEKDEKTTVFSCDNTGKSLHEIGDFYNYLDLRANLDVKNNVKSITDIAIIAMAEICKIDCGGSYWGRLCGCEDNNPRMEKKHGCMNEDCKSCSEDIKFRRTKKVLPRLNAKRYTSPVLYTIVTVPPELRKKAENSKTWYYWVKRFLEVLKRDYGLKYGFGSSHPIGDENPDIFHPHHNFIWTQHPGFSALLDVNQLRKEWKKIIGYKNKGNVDVWHGFTNDDELIFNRVSYAVRPFPGWHFWRGKSVRWYGNYPKKNKDYKEEKYEIKDEICEKCGQKISYWLIRDYLHGEKRYKNRIIFKSGFT